MKDTKLEYCFNHPMENLLLKKGTDYRDVKAQEKFKDFENCINEMGL